MLAELRGKLEHARWPPILHDGGWNIGAEYSYLRDLVAAWRESYDWRDSERRLNTFPQYTADLDGASVHFVHLRCQSSPTARPGSTMPILLLHGWPYTFAELLELGGRLAKPSGIDGDAPSGFDVVIPSLPGYIFSTVPTRRFSWRDVPSLMVSLMTDMLGYDRFAVHGSDVGGWLTNRIALEFPERVLGIHLTSGRPGVKVEGELSEEEEAFLAEDKRWDQEDAAYSYLHETRPMAAAYCLADSPVGLAGWTVEKLHEWTDLGASTDFEQVWTRDRVLTLLTLYWVTNSMATSLLSYYELVQDPDPRPWGSPTVPAAFAMHRNDIAWAPRSWIDRGYENVVHWSESPQGGHFPAVERPDDLAKDIRLAARFFR